MGTPSTSLWNLCVSFYCQTETKLFMGFVQTPLYTHTLQQHTVSFPKIHSQKMFAFPFLHRHTFSVCILPQETHFWLEISCGPCWRIRILQDLFTWNCCSGLYSLWAHQAFHPGLPNTWREAVFQISFSQFTVILLGRRTKLLYTPSLTTDQNSPSFLPRPQRRLHYSSPPEGLKTHTFIFRSCSKEPALWQG